MGYVTATGKRVRIALDELDYLEEILKISETKDFVEVVGGIGGDIYRYRVYFDSCDKVTGVYEK